MPFTQAEFDHFQSFAAEKLANGGAESLQELVDLWHAEAPPDAELQSSLAALDEGLADARAGRTRPAREIFDELAGRFGLDLPE